MAQFVVTKIGNPRSCDADSTRETSCSGPCELEAEGPNRVHRTMTEARDRGQTTKWPFEFVPQ